MKNVTLENVDLIADLFEETWTEEGAIVIYPYEDNLIQLLSQEDLNRVYYKSLFPVNFPVFTSIAVKASVLSIVINPPQLSQIFLFSIFSS